MELPMPSESSLVGWCVALVLLLAHASPAQWQTHALTVDSQKLLRNRDHGIEYMIEDLIPVDRLPEWVAQSCSTIYFRLDWAELCDERGEPDFDKLDQDYFDGYRKAGFKLSFRVMLNNQSTTARFVVPEAVIRRFDIPTQTMMGRRGTEQEVVVFWSDACIEAYDQFMAAFGAWFDGKPWAGQVELGTIGEWGEMHLGGRWTHDLLERHGFGPETFYRTAARYMRIVERHCPRSTKAFCWAPIFNADPMPAYEHFLDNALRRGWWLRSDGLSDNDGAQPMVDRAYGRVRDHLALIGEGGPRQRDDEGLRRFYQRNVDDGVAVINPLGSARVLSEEHPRIAREFASRFGARLAVESVATLVVPARDPMPSRLLLEVRLLQAGNVPSFRPVLIRASLAQGERVVHEQLVVPATPVFQIAPGGRSRELVVIPLSGIEPGTHDDVSIRLTLIDEEDDRPIDLPHPHQQPDGSIRINGVKLDPTTGQEVVVRYLASRDGVEGAPAVNASIDGATVHLQGDRGNEAFFVQQPATTPIHQDTLYLCHGRFRIRSMTPDHGHVFHWLNVRTESDELSGFQAGPAYDGLTAAGEWGAWQSSTIVYRPQPGDATLRLMLLGKQVNVIDAQIDHWSIEEVRLQALP
jgi:hypothetical protein